MNIFKRLGIGLVGAVIAGGSVAACDSGPVYNGYCVQQGTFLRFADSYCNQPGYGWYYVQSGRTVPRIGAKATDGSTSVPSKGKVSKGGLPTSGGKAPSSAPKGSTKQKPPKVNTKKNGTGGGSGGGSKVKPAQPKPVAPKAPAPKGK